jgi:hypothetical protein
MTTPRDTPASRRTRPNGDGTIYQRKDGRWEAAAYILVPRQHPQTPPRLRHHPQRGPGQTHREDSRQQPRHRRPLRAGQRRGVPHLLAGDRRRPPAP